MGRDPKARPGLWGHTTWPRRRARGWLPAVLPGDASEERRASARRRAPTRLPPWPDKVPFTKGDERTVYDVALYVALIAALVVALALPGAGDGLVSTAAIVPIIVLLVALGLRDKVAFIAARSEQYIPALIFFA